MKRSLVLICVLISSPFTVDHFAQRPHKTHIIVRLLRQRGLHPRFAIKTTLLPILSPHLLVTDTIHLLS